MVDQKCRHKFLDFYTWKDKQIEEFLVEIDKESNNDLLVLYS